MSNNGGFEGIAGVELEDLRFAFAQEIEACRSAAWSALRQEGERGTIPLASCLTL